MLSFELEADRGIGWATLSRPQKLNAMTRAFWSELRELLADAGADRRVRVLVFRGSGRCFSVGGDIEGFAELGGLADKRAYVREALGALRRLEEFSKPTVAAVHGVALGGGCELTMVCDIVVADETARFGTPECGVGLVPGLGIARGLAQLNLHWMKYMVLTGETLSAHEAQLAGLVNQVVKRGEHELAAGRLASKIAENAPLALAVAKEALNGSAQEAWSQAIDAVSLLQCTRDFDEGIAAFREKRAPRFTGC